MINELREAMEGDTISQSLMPKTISLHQILPKNKDTVEDVESKCQLLLDIFGNKYKSKIEKEIVLACDTTDQRNRIILLAKLYVSTLVSHGFHRSFIYQQICIHFFNNDIKNAIDIYCEDFFQGSQKSKDLFQYLSLAKYPPLYHLTGCSAFQL